MGTIVWVEANLRLSGRADDRLPVDADESGQAFGVAGSVLKCDSTWRLGCRVLLRKLNKREAQSVGSPHSLHGDDHGRLGL